VLFPSLPPLSRTLTRRQWKRISGGRPFVLKGVQSAGDAVRAADIGCDGVVVTNHAGRQVDGAVGSLEVLPEVVDAVGSRIKVIFDSGVRTGADVFKALALGAHAVQVGRLYIWGMTHEGEYGCRHVMKSLLAIRAGRVVWRTGLTRAQDLDILMTVAGYPTLKDINRDALRYNPSGSPPPKGEHAKL
jgi:isopentenyl diphosphate isomerase/L-lactate dehydrogenase-like FMN-dependent dehydrogenase